MKVGTWIIT